MIGDGDEPSFEIDQVFEVGVIEDVLEAEQQIAKDHDITKGNTLLHEISSEQQMIVQDSVEGKEGFHSKRLIC